MHKELFIELGATIKDALLRLEKARGLGLIVVSEDKSLLGVLSDGDIRRAIISGVRLNDLIDEIFNKQPVFVNQDVSESELKKITSDQKIKIVPIVNNGKVVDVFKVDDDTARGVSVVIMAGGLGSRLGDYTKDCPKPMLDIGGKPVLERIINNFTKVGFGSFFISVNYMAEVIENYFENGENFGCRINYLREKIRLGTAGSLTLLPDDISGPIVVTNGDLLTLVDYRRLLAFHNQHQSLMTMCTREFDFQVPYGVVNIENGKVRSISEKPVHSFNVSAGVYVIDSALLKFIPRDSYFDMPTFLDVLLENNIHTECFPLIEQWIDIGRVSDLDLARSIYEERND